MRKKKLLRILIPVFILAFILFFPIPVETRNDGGSRDFRALTYRLIRWNRILPAEDGTVDFYTKWQIYPMTLRYASVDDLWEREVAKNPALEIFSYDNGFYATVSQIREKGLLVNGLESNPLNFRYEFSCSVGEETVLLKNDKEISLSDLRVGDTVFVQFSGEIMETYPAQIPNVKKITVTSTAGTVDYKASYLRVDGSGNNAHVFSEFSENKAEADGFNRLPIVAIESKTELSQIISSLKNGDAYTSTVLWNDTELFTEFPTAYDETFFREKALLLVYIAESSGSISHKIHSCAVEDGICTVIVESIVPETGTCDMAGWLVCLEVKKDAVENVSFDSYRLRK